MRPLLGEVNETAYALGSSTRAGTPQARRAQRCSGPPSYDWPSMLILLPPSECKSTPRSGKPVDLEALAYPGLTPARREVLDALAAVSARPDAAALLKVPAGAADAVVANAHLATAPTAPASRVYAGVLFDALGHATLTAPAKRRAARSVLIFSALFGVLRLGDRIPAYRLSAGTSLPGVGPLTPFWRRHLEALDDDGGARVVVVDCRSSSYATMWRPAGALGVRVFRERDGTRTAVSHMAKHARGLVARALLEAPHADDADDAVAAVAAWFATHEVRTATGELVDVRVERAGGHIDVITWKAR